MSKNFNDFLKTLTEEEIIKMTEKVNDKEIVAHFSLTPEGINDFLTKSTSYNLLINLQLLEKYHNWLHSEQ